MKILFLDIDDVLISDRCSFLEYESHLPDKNGFYNETEHWVTYDPFAVKFLNHLFEMNDYLHTVLHSTWRQHYDWDFIEQHFKYQGCNFRWHSDWKTDPKFPRWSSINNWLVDHPEITREQYAILDDEKPTEYFKSRTVRVPEQNGLTFKNCDRLIQLLNLKWKKLK